MIHFTVQILILHQINTINKKSRKKVLLSLTSKSKKRAFLLQTNLQFKSSQAFSPCSCSAPIPYNRAKSNKFTTFHPNNNNNQHY